MADILDLIAQAIAKFEGFGDPGKIPTTHNNPGDIREWGHQPIVKGYVQFSTVEEGWTALRHQVEKNVARGLTFLEFFAGKPGVYAGFSPGADGNHPRAYAQFVVGRLNESLGTAFTPDTVIVETMTRPLAGSW